jgi:multidrug transporter EmrE-like cation transporter
MIGYFYLVCMVALTGIAQYLVKRGGLKLRTDSGIGPFIGSFFNRGNAVAALLMVIAPVFYIMALRYLPLSTAYIFSGLNFVVVALIGRLVFHEPLSARRLTGLALIVTGIIVFAI